MITKGPRKLEVTVSVNLPKQRGPKPKKSGPLVDNTILKEEGLKRKVI